MKVKVLDRDEEQFTRERAQDVKKVHRNYDPALHQFTKAHEYARALNAAKLERVFAKPFVAALAHADGVTALARNPKRLNSVVAGSADGDIRIWDIPMQRALRRLVGHAGAVRGIGFAPGGEACVSAGSDASVKLWKVPYAPFEAGDVCAETGPVLEFQGRHAFRAVDHHWARSTFATAGAAVELWDHARSEPIASFEWGSDSVVAVRFNPVRSISLLAAACCCLLLLAAACCCLLLLVPHCAATSPLHLAAASYLLVLAPLPNHLPPRKTSTKHKTQSQQQQRRPQQPHRPSPTSSPRPARTARSRCTTCALGRRCASS